MPLDNCVRCGKLFNRLSRPICPDCAGEEERQANVVMGFLKDNPNATIEETSESTGVDSQVILRLIRDDRLRATAACSLPRNCKACGAPIDAGQYCGQCLRKFGRALTGKDSGDSGYLRDGLSDADRARVARMAVPERRRGDKKP